MQDLALDPDHFQERCAPPLMTVAIASGKGGVGRTNIAANLAVAAAMEGRSVSVLDGDFGLSDINILLGLQTERNLSHVLNGDCDLEDVALTGPEGITVIPAGSGLVELTRLTDVQRAGVIEAFSSLKQAPDLLIVDTRAGICDNVCTFSRAVQEVLLVVCDEPTAIADARALTEVLHRDHGIHRFHVIANRVDDVSHGRKLFETFSNEVDRSVDAELRLLGIVPEDDYLRRAVREQKPVVRRFPMSKSALALRKLARSLRLMPAVTPLHGHVQFFVERLAAQGSS